MSSDQPRRGRESTGSVGSPMGSTAAIVIAVIAVVAGFLILRQIRDDDNGGSDSADVTTTVPSDTTAAPVTVATTAAPTTPTTAPKVTEGAKVVVANASRVDGAAGVLTTALNGQGYDMAQATNAGGSEAKLEVSKVYYDPANAQALAVASSIAAQMGNVAVVELVSPPPLADGAMPEGVTVLVMLGSDKAAKTLEQMSAPETTTTTVAGATTATTVAP